MKSLDKVKRCYCHTCGRWFHYLGIARHRHAHLKRGEVCEITYSNGDTWTHEMKNDHGIHSKANV